MTTEFDPRKSYLTLKAHEKMIAYVSFRFAIDGKLSGREGVIKISSFNRPYGGGQLTLTFIVDTEGNEALKHELNGLFDKITDESVRSKLGLCGTVKPASAHSSTSASSMYWPCSDRLV